jgi:hypothetical protein
MKRKNNVTDAVRAANQANAKFSTGPRTTNGKSQSSYNAVRHGILAGKVVLNTDEQRVEFRELLQRCFTELRPTGLFENVLVEEIAVTFWKLRIVEGVEIQEILRRQERSDDVEGIFQEDLKLPITHGDLPLDRGWDCERMIVRAVSDRRGSDAMSRPGVLHGQVIDSVRQTSDHRKLDQLQVEAVLVNTLETVTRYQAKLKRDLYRAIDRLCEMQAKRRERHK